MQTFARLILFFTLIIILFPFIVAALSLVITVGLAALIAFFMFGRETSEA